MKTCILSLLQNIHKYAVINYWSMDNTVFGSRLYCCLLLTLCPILLNSDSGQYSGDVLVFKHPGLHFGDIHILTARQIDGLEKNFIGYSKNAILFPTSGQRSLADEMAGSDFDGDEFWVSRNHMVSSFLSIAIMLWLGVCLVHEIFCFGCCSTFVCI